MSNLLPQHTQLHQLKQLGGGSSDSGSSSITKTDCKEDSVPPSLNQDHKEERTDGLTDQTNLLPTPQVIVIFLGGSACLFCSVLDQTILSTSLTAIGSYFNASDRVNWVATSYLLSSAAIMPMHARLSDLIGRKYALMLCMAIFWIGSLACALSQSIEQLILFRAIAGIGNGGIKTNVQVIVSDVVSLKERGKYQGILSLWTALANGIGPLLGGIFCQTIGWRWAFWINLPLTGASIAIIQFFLPFKKIEGDWRTKLRKLDYIGSVLVFVATFLILLSLNWGGNNYKWDTAPVLTPLIIGVVLMVVFIVVENSEKLVKLPIIPMHLFTNRSVSASYACTFLTGMIYFGSLFYLPQYLQVVGQYSAIASGALILSLILTQTICAFVAGMVVSRTSQYVVNIRAGFLLWSVGCGLYITLGIDTPIANFIGYSILAGVGAGNTFQTTLVSVQAAVSRMNMAVATGGRNFLRMFGGVIALALCDTILRSTLKSGLNGMGMSEDDIDRLVADPTQIDQFGDTKADVLGSYCKGIRNIFIMLTACAGCAFFVSFLIEQLSLVRNDEKVLKEEGEKFAQGWKIEKSNKKWWKS